MNFLCNIAESLHLKNTKKQILIIFVYIYFSSDYAGSSGGEKRIYAGSRCCQLHGFYAQCIETMYFIAPYGADGGQMGTCFCLVVTAKAGFVFRQGVVWSLFPGNGAGRTGNFPGGRCVGEFSGDEERFQCEAWGGCKKSMTVQPYRSANCCRRLKLTGLWPFSIRQMVSAFSPNRRATSFWVRSAFRRRCCRL